MNKGRLCRLPLLLRASGDFYTPQSGPGDCRPHARAGGTLRGLHMISNRLDGKTTL